jgi:hypothetical protein
MVAGQSDVALFRAEIERILASPEFASSRQLQEFLRYTSEKAFVGESQLDQSEIAVAVLRRGRDFNPLEDAAVRKMASLVRQRLDHYYSQPGLASDVVVTLPVRCYVPKFERRLRDETGGLLTAPAPAGLARTRKRPLALAGAIAVVMCAGIWILFGTRTLFRDALAVGRTVELWTVKGDINSGWNDAPGAGVQLGPKLRDMDEISARLDFTPNREAQQAGLIVWQDGNHFIRLGRKFFGRNQIEFMLQEERASLTTPANTVYDAEGQGGQPIWLAIRRRDNSYQAYLSHDGVRWEPHGEPVVPHRPFAGARAGVYALNGRRDAPSIRAAFHNLATGWTFHGSAFPPSPGSDWIVTNTCPDLTTAAIEGPALRITFSANPGSCNYDISRPLGTGDWEISTRLDSFPLPGRSAGVRVQGSKGVIRVVRYFLNGPAIAFINDARTLLGKPDLNGSPAIVLRLASRKGNLVTGYSADGEHFEQLPVSMKVEELGGNLRGGIRFSTTATDQEEPSSAARFHYYREAVTNLVPYR